VLARDLAKTSGSGRGTQSAMRANVMPERVGEPKEASAQAAEETPSSVPQPTTMPAPRPSGCDSDAVIDLPPSLRLVPGPDAVTFCGFLDADEVVLEDQDLVSEAPPPSAAAARHEKLLPPPLCTEEDFDEEIIYPTPER
jgi:hypothetical protein